MGNEHNRSEENGLKYLGAFNMRVCLCVSVCSSDMPGEEEDDTIHMGNAIMTFYAALIDLLGRCAPEMHVSYFALYTCVCSAVSVMSMSSWSWSMTDFYRVLLWKMP